MTIYIEPNKALNEGHQRIKAAAIYQDRAVYWSPQPARHHDLIRMMAKFMPTPISGLQGFITESGAMVTREEALQIAMESGQIIEKHGHKGMLFSEDMW